MQIADSQVMTSETADLRPATKNTAAGVDEVS